MHHWGAIVKSIQQAENPYLEDFIVIDYCRHSILVCNEMSRQEVVTAQLIIVADAVKKEFLHKEDTARSYGLDQELYWENWVAHI